jgi:hypothetical protein
MFIQVFSTSVDVMGKCSMGFPHNLRQKGKQGRVKQKSLRGST